PPAPGLASAQTTLAPRPPSSIATRPRSGERADHPRAKAALLDRRPPRVWRPRSPPPRRTRAPRPPSGPPFDDRADHARANRDLLDRHPPLFAIARRPPWRQG